MKVGRKPLSTKPTRVYMFRHEIGFMNALCKQFTGEGQKEDFSKVIRKCLEMAMDIKKKRGKSET